MEKGLPQKMKNNIRNTTIHTIKLSPIGIIHSPFKTTAEAPYQGRGTDQVSEVEVFEDYQKGLQDIEGFSYLILIYFFHLSEGYSLLTHTPWDTVLHGVFSTRSPHRPCPLGLSVVTLLHREKNILRVKDLDAVDGTPLLDIKPYSPGIDGREAADTGWMKGKLNL
jgi:tRNA-Thr(GGU) m(6)t(6)A37 methyltransferase TsaA